MNSLTLSEKIIGVLRKNEKQNLVVREIKIWLRIIFFSSKNFPHKYVYSQVSMHVMMELKGTQKVTILQIQRLVKGIWMELDAGILILLKRRPYRDKIN